MAVKWSAFPAGTAIAGGDIVVGLQGGANVQWPWSDVSTYIGSLYAALASANVFTSAVQTVQSTTGTSPGWYARITGDSVPRVRVGLNASDVASVGFGPGSGAHDLFLERAGAANLRIGAPDAASPVAQTISVQSVVAGTSNTAGANLTIAGSKGTGTGGGGSIILQVAPADGSGTSQNTLSTAVTIASTLATTFAGDITQSSAKKVFIGATDLGALVNINDPTNPAINSLYVLAANGMTNGSACVLIDTGTTTGVAIGIQASGVSSGDQQFGCRNTHATGSRGFNITGGSSSTGDYYVAFAKDGGTAWTMGFEGSTLSGAFYISGPIDGGPAPSIPQFGINVSAGNIYTKHYLTAAYATAIPAGGNQDVALKGTSTANFGVYFGSGAPSVSAAKGSLYLRSDGSGINDRAYINTDGSTAWTAVVTVA